jgi:excisionase family DNA binding protein
LKDLESYPEAYVTIGELSRYWLVSRKQLYKQIQAGTLPAIRLGPRLFRIETTKALAFERGANMRVSSSQDRHPSSTSTTHQAVKPHGRAGRG